MKNWGTHIFIYDYKKINGPYNKCETCGIKWIQLSNDYWSVTNNGFIQRNISNQVKKIITCNEFFIKSIIE